MLGRRQVPVTCRRILQVLDYSLIHPKCCHSSSTKSPNEKVLQHKKETQFGCYSVVKPANVSPQRYVPEHIPKPPYLNPGYFLKRLVFGKLKEIDIKNEEQIEGMRNACALAKQILQHTESYAKPGVTTDEIDQVVHDMCIQNNAYPSTLLYKSFPKSVCTSVNNVACHGIPDDRPLQDGDIVNIDITVSMLVTTVIY